MFLSPPKFEIPNASVDDAPDIARWITERSLLDYDTMIPTEFYARAIWSRFSGQIHFQLEDFERTTHRLEEMCQRAVKGGSVREMSRVECGVLIIFNSTKIWPIQDQANPTLKPTSIVNNALGRNVVSLEGVYFGFLGIFGDLVLGSWACSSKLDKNNMICRNSMRLKR